LIGLGLLAVVVIVVGIVLILRGPGGDAFAATPTSPLAGIAAAAATRTPLREPTRTPQPATPTTLPTTEARVATVPNVIGMDVRSACSAIEEAGFGWLVVEVLIEVQEEQATRTAGIVEQSPAAGEQFLVGDEVIITHGIYSVVPPTRTPTHTPRPPTRTPTRTPTPTSAPTLTPTPEGLIHCAKSSGWVGWAKYDTETVRFGYEPSKHVYRMAIHAPPGWGSSMVDVQPDQLLLARPGDVAVRMVGYPDPESAPSLAVGLLVRSESDWTTGSLCFVARPFQGNYSIEQRLPDGSWDSHVLFQESPEIWLDDDGMLTVEVFARGDTFGFYVNGIGVDSLSIEVPAQGSAGAVIAVGDDGWATFNVTDFEVWHYD
jgi:hypothetical protein